MSYRIKCFAEICIDNISLYSPPLIVGDVNSSSTRIMVLDLKLTDSCRYGNNV